MDMSSKLDRVGPDHQIRRRMRDFLLVRYGYELEGSVLSRLADYEAVPAAKVKPEIDRLIANKWTYDDVYPVTAEDLADFARYVDQQILGEKALSQIKKAARLSLDAGISHRDFQIHTVELFEQLQTEDVIKEEKAEAARRQDTDISMEP